MGKAAVIYDITQPLFGCQVYPGDPGPEQRALCRMKDGDLYNLTAISLCVHNGTHVDAPFHFYQEGKGVDEIPLEAFIGPACVATHTGALTGEDAEKLLERARRENPESWKRLLLKGSAVVTLEAAKVFAAAGILLIGNESQTVGPEDGPMAVHLVLLKEEIVLLEGIRLADVPDGVYLLNCAPINLSGLDGAPCRAVLMDLR